MFVIPTLELGGAERVASVLCSAWVEMGHKVSVLTFAPQGSTCAYELDPRIEVVPLDILTGSGSLGGTMVRNLRRVRSLFAHLRRRKPDVLVSFLTEANISAALAGRAAGVPVILSERIHPGAHSIIWFRDIIRRLTYRYAHCIVVQTPDIRVWCEARWTVPVAMLPNPISESFFAYSQTTPSAQGRHVILSVGRLMQQKRFDLLIKAFATIVREPPDWDLHIAGQGPLESALRSQIVSLGLEKRVQLLGVVNDLPSRMAAAEIVCQSSDYEGFPNVIAEALAIGSCVLATDSPGAARDLLGNGRFGVLTPVGDAEALALALSELMASPQNRAKYRASARGAVAHLTPHAVAGQWLQVMEGIQRRPGRQAIRSILGL